MSATAVAFPDLPPRARELAEVIGEDGLWRLVEHFGGTPVRVHTTARPGSKLAKCLGPEAYAALQQRYRSEEILVPLVNTSRRHQLAAEVVTARERGETVASIARRYRVTTRNVYLILARERARRTKRPTATNRTEQTHP